MAGTHIVYDTTTGRILAAHHFRGEEADPEMSRRAVIEFDELGPSGDQIGVFSVADYAVDKTRHYRVNAEDETLVEVAEDADDGGVRFNFDGTQSSGNGS